MPTDCPQLDSTARKILGAILNGLGRTGQTNVADAIGKDESTLSKMKDKELPQLAKILAACGLKVVPSKVKCYDPEMIGAVFYLARANLSRLENPSELEWDE